MRWVWLAMASSGCLFPSLDGLSSPTDASADVADASLDALPDVMDASLDAGAEAEAGPLATDDFELGCSPYSGQNANITTTTVAHGGSSACQVCCTGSGSYCTLDRGTQSITSVSVGKTYTATAWMRIAPQTSNASLTGAVFEREILGGSYTASSTYSQSTLTQSWMKLSNQLQITQAGDGLNVYLGLGSYVAGDCFLVDDVSVTASP